jgi:hypothetical protein
MGYAFSNLDIIRVLVCQLHDLLHELGRDVSRVDLGKLRTGDILRHLRGTAIRIQLETGEDQLSLSPVGTGAHIATWGYGIR